MTVKSSGKAGNDNANGVGLEFSVDVVTAVVAVVVAGGRGL